MLPFRPAFRRDEYTLPLELQLPMVPWELESGGVGGSAVSSAGVPESYVLRNDRLALIEIRVLEEELEAVLQELEAIRADSAPFVFSFDQDDAATDHTVYLEAPVWPERIRPKRDDQFPGAFRLALQLRTVDGSPFVTSWSSTEAEP